MSAVTVDDAALLGVLRAFRTFEKEQKREVQVAVKRTALPLFREAYTQRRRTPQQAKAAGIGLASLTAGGKGSFKGYSTSSKPLSGGLDAAGSDWPFIEFGSKQPGYGGTRLPYWVKGGRIFYAAVKVSAPVAQRAFMAATYDVLREIPGASDG